MATVRKFKFSATVVAAAALLLSACGGSSDSASSASVDTNVDITTQKLVISNWAGYYPEDLAAKVKEAIGVDITITNHANNEEIMGKLTASDDSGIDIAFVSGQYAQALASGGKIVNFDKAAIPNLANLYPEVADLAYDKGNNYSAPYAWGTTGICYRSDLVDFTPDSWNDLLNPKDSIKGKTTMLATERWLALPAMKLLGYSMNTTNADEIAKAKEQLVKTKPTLLAYDDTAYYTKLVSGEAVLSESWDGWCNYGIAENPAIKFVIPKEGSDLWADTMVILSSSENKEAAHAFINYILQADVHAWVANNILYKVPNKAATETLDPALATSYPNMGLTPAELLKGEVVLDLGTDSKLYTDLATSVTSS